MFFNKIFKMRTDLKAKTVNELKPEGGKKHHKRHGKKMVTILFNSGLSEPKYDGFQIWVHADIPDYNDEKKNVINVNIPIKNYLI